MKKLLERFFSFIDAAARDECPEQRRDRGLEQCAPGIDEAAAARLRYWLESRDTRGPQPKAPFSVSACRDGGCFVLNVEPRPRRS
jgi:hypothetical protein